MISPFFLHHKVGRTPLRRMSFLEPNEGIEIHAKLEWQQLGGSVKSRPAFRILKQAIASGQWRSGMHMLDATSGNTGIAYATFCQAAGIPLTLCLPENASQERKDLLAKLGAEIILTSPFEGTDGAQEEAQRLVRTQPWKYVYLDQYSNPENWRAHSETTAEEIWEQTEGRITHFVAGLGTTGTFVGTSRRLTELSSIARRGQDIIKISLQPETALHGLEGWKHLETAHIPGIYDAEIPDEQQRVSTEASYAMIRRVFLECKLRLSPSAAANLAGTLAIAKKKGPGVYVTILADDASKYSEVYKRLKLPIQ